METTKDLFEHPELLPIEVQNVLNQYTETWGESYEDCNRLLEALKPHGYTFEYYLDAIPFNLQKIDNLSILSTEWEKWCHDNQMPFESARDVLYQMDFGSLGDEATEEQRNYVLDFLKRWDNEQD